MHSYPQRATRKQTATVYSITQGRKLTDVSTDLTAYKERVRCLQELLEEQVAYKNEIVSMITQRCLEVEAENRSLRAMCQIRLVSSSF